MVLKLYGASLSSCTRRVAIVLHEKKVPFEFHPIDFSKGEHKAPAHVAKQPFGQVPYIDDDGFVLFESRAIARYLALKYAGQGTPLIPSPSDIQKTAKFEEAASIEWAAFEPYAGKVCMEKMVNPFLGIPTNQAAVDEALKALDTKLDVYDQILGKQKYLGGDEISVVDLSHIPRGLTLKAVGYDVFESKPNVKRWWTEIASRPSVVALEKGIDSVEQY